MAKTYVPYTVVPIFTPDRKLKLCAICERKMLQTHKVYAGDNKSLEYKGRVHLSCYKRKELGEA